MTSEEFESLKVGAIVKYAADDGFWLIQQVTSVIDATSSPNYKSRFYKSVVIMCSDPTKFSTGKKFYIVDTQREETEVLSE